MAAVTADVWISLSQINRKIHKSWGRLSTPFHVDNINSCTFGSVNVTGLFCSMNSSKLSIWIPWGNTWWFSIAIVACFDKEFHPSQPLSGPSTLSEWLIGEAPLTRFFGESFTKSVYPSTHPRVFVRLGETKGENWVEKGDFRGDFFEGFGPCLGISHPTHPHLGKISQKKFFFWQLPLFRS